MLKASKFRFRKSIFPADLKDRSSQIRLMKIARTIFKFFTEFRKVDPNFNEMAVSDKLTKFLPEPNLKTSKCNRTLSKFEDMNIYKYTPKSVSNNHQIIYLHGGGWTIGNIEKSYHPLLDNIADQMSVEIIAPEFQNAPKAPFPIALNQCENFVKNYLQKSESQERKISIMGDSAGSNLATVITFELIKQNFIHLTHHIFLLYPYLNVLTTNTPSYNSPIGQYIFAKQNSSAFCLNYSGLDFNSENLLTLQTIQTHPENFKNHQLYNFLSNPKVSPLLYPDEVYQKVLESPVKWHLDIPTYDPLFTEGMQFFEKLANNRNKNVSLRFAEGSTHGWLQLMSSYGIGIQTGNKESDKEFEKMTKYMKNLLDDEWKN